MTQGGGEEKSTFRWLDAARYAVAAAVTVLIMAIIVNAIKVILRPESLQLSVRRGAVSAAPLRPPPPPETVAVDLNLRTQNPSGRVRMYYLNITAYLFDKDTPASASLTPVFDSVVYFRLNDIAVPQQEVVDSMVAMKLHKKDLGPYFDVLYNGSRVTSELNKSRQASYYCEQLLVGGSSDDEAIKYRQDVICKQGRGLN